MSCLLCEGELAYCGHTVHVYDKNPEVLDTVPEQIRLAKKELRAEGLMPHIDFIVSLSPLLPLLFKSTLHFTPVKNAKIL